MLGWLLLGALLTAAVLTICVPFLNRQIAKDKMRENGIKKGTIKEIITSNNVTHIKLDALKDDGTEQEVEFEVEGYDSGEIRKAITLVA